MNHYKKVRDYYLGKLNNPEIKGNFIKSSCPFCQKQTKNKPGLISINISESGFFNGFFRCTEKCVHGGYPHYFSKLMGQDPSDTPTFDPDYEPYVFTTKYPHASMNNKIAEFISYMNQDNYDYFARYGISEKTLTLMKIGFNGRYLVYPYFQENGSCYAARCILPEISDDSFWLGDETFSGENFRIFNVEEFQRCQDGALFVTDSELNLLLIKELGFPGVSVPESSDLEYIHKKRFDKIRYVFLLVENTPESYQYAKNLATRIGFKARIIRWPHHYKRGFNLADLALSKGKNFHKAVLSMIQSSSSFSPFSSPEKEFSVFSETLENERGKEILGHKTGLEKLDQAHNGLSGINIMGGLPKAGKSCFCMQISTEIARRKVPVIYYDFENGRKKIYTRTLSRLSQLSEADLREANPGPESRATLESTYTEFKNLLTYFRVITDRSLSPATMKRHIDFIRHETHSEKTFVVIDSLHKLPFKDLSERRTGIDSWLRTLESIRDEMNVTFLVISELSRQTDGTYSQTPDIGSFKDSGDIEYSADNAMIFMPDWDILDPISTQDRKSTLWMVASRENSPGKIARYQLDYPYWGFREEESL